MSLSSFLNTYLYCMNAAKIRLSEKEKELVINADWILTKNDILQKVNSLLGEVHTRQFELLQPLAKALPAEVSSSSPKISKGENYKGLPYLVLDYPRCFDRENIFAIRTFFWWGHFFSVTLHVSGTYKQNLAGNITRAYPLLAAEGFSYCVQEDPWEHHFGDDNFQLIGPEKNNFEERINRGSFVKLAKKIPLEQWEQAIIVLPEYFSQLLKIVIG